LRLRKKLVGSRRTTIKTSSCPKSQDLIEQELPAIDFRTKTQGFEEEEEEEEEEE